MQNSTIPLFCNENLKRLAWPGTQCLEMNNRGKFQVRHKDQCILSLDSMNQNKAKTPYPGSDYKDELTHLLLGSGSAVAHQ